MSFHPRKSQSHLLPLRQAAHLGLGYKFGATVATSPPTLITDGTNGRVPLLVLVYDLYLSFYNDPVSYSHRELGPDS